MKNKIIYPLLLLSLFLYAQQDSVYYEIKYHEIRDFHIEQYLSKIPREYRSAVKTTLANEFSDNKLILDFTLITNGNLSKYFASPKLNNSQISSGIKNQIQNIRKDVIYKNFELQKLWEYQDILNKKYLIEDSIFLPFKGWNILELETEETILDYKTKLIIAKKDSSLVKVYYTDEIKIPDGPGKYFGLSGLILKLKIEEENNNQEIIAYNIKKKENKPNIKIPEKAKKVNKEEFLREINKLKNELIKGSNISF